MSNQNNGNASDKNIDLLVRIKEKSEDDFEKNITFISAGTLALSLTFIEKIVDFKIAVYKSELILGWVFLAASLLLNLCTHMLASYFSDKFIDDYYDRPRLANKNIKRRNFIMRYLNVLTVLIMIIGILFLISFSSKNALMAKEKSQPSSATNNLQNEQKGRTQTPIRPSPKNELAYNFFKLVLEGARFMKQQTKKEHEMTRRIGKTFNKAT